MRRDAGIRAIAPPSLPLNAAATPACSAALGGGKTATLFGQTAARPDVRFLTNNTTLTLAEYLCDDRGEDVLPHIDTIFRKTPSSALSRRGLRFRG